MFSSLSNIVAPRYHDAGLGPVRRPSAWRGRRQGAQCGRSRTGLPGPQHDGRHTGRGSGWLVSFLHYNLSSNCAHVSARALTLLRPSNLGLASSANTLGQVESRPFTHCHLTRPWAGSWATPSSPGSSPSASSPSHSSSPPVASSSSSPPPPWPGAWWTPTR